MEIGEVGEAGPVIDLFLEKSSRLVSTDDLRTVAEGAAGSPRSGRVADPPDRGGWRIPADEVDSA